MLKVFVRSAGSYVLSFLLVGIVCGAAHSISQSKQAGCVGSATVILTAAEWGACWAVP